MGWAGVRVGRVAKQNQESLGAREDTTAQKHEGSSLARLGTCWERGNFPIRATPWGVCSSAMMREDTLWSRVVHMFVNSASITC